MKTLGIETNELPTEEVWRRLKSYSFGDDKLATHLNDFSARILAESEARSAALEDKANKL